MRDIKFRIWDETRDKMHENNNISYIDFKENLVCVYDYIDYYEDTRFLFKNNSVIMQYTGLKDKNGKEIYEGDILSYKHIVYTDCSKTEIEKIEDEAFIEIINYAPIASVVKAHSENVKCFGHDTINNQFLIIDLKSDEVEVIGNTYENPELLK
ncbi:hypothetical protein WS9_015460 [Paraclostridium sordellii 8483]|uniref:YopX family protein n=1 Tax=Paraclostridium sordellii TaxID=1505 RepID=UPI000311A448|nr:YopX family protein [Paeniclostridium sordellii]TAN63740.1 hypothetical protein WS9_015460 [Paeniclostridium sordellii 8483]